MAHTPAGARLISYALDRLSVVSGSLVLAPAQRVGGLTVGVYDCTERNLTIAVGNPQWLGVLAHEIGHVEQEIEGLYPSGASWVIFDRWLEKPTTTIAPRTLLRAVREIQHCEHDAERRALRLIRDMKLPVDPWEYARQANAYLWGHEFARLYRRWPSTGSALCPARLVPLRALRSVPPAVASAFGSGNSDEA